MPLDLCNSECAPRGAQLEYKIGVLELENMELEHNRMLHEHIVRQRDLAVQRLRLQVRAHGDMHSRVRAPMRVMDMSNAAARTAVCIPVCARLLATLTEMHSRMQLRARDRVIEEQRRVLAEHDLGHLISYDGLAGVDEAVSGACRGLLHAID